MQYFVVTEDSRNFRWQTELLLESLRLLNLEDKTVVAVCPGLDAKGINYPNPIKFENVGRKLDYLPYNKTYGLLKALESGVLRQPFVVLEPDMFLLRDVSVNFSVAAAQQLDKLQWERVKLVIDDYTSGSDWIPVGGVYQFNGVPSVVFEDAHKHAHDLLRRYGRYIDIPAWAFILAITKNGLNYEKRNDYCMPLKKDESPGIDWTSHVVHYSDGFPPYFVKDKAFESIEFSFKMPLPFKKILEIPIQNQPNVSLMKTLIRSWMNKNINRLDELMF